MVRLILSVSLLLIFADDASAFGHRGCGAACSGARAGGFLEKFRERRHHSSAAAPSCNCGPGCICQPAGACGGANCPGYQCGPKGTQLKASTPGAYWVPPHCENGKCYPGSWVNPPAVTPKSAPAPMPNQKDLDFSEQAPMPQLREIIVFSLDF